MRPLAFVASYPRSGNTFARTLLANYELSHLGGLNIDQVVQYGSGEKNEAIWRAVTGLAPERRPLDAFIQAMPQYYRIVRSSPGFGPLVMKSHTINTPINGKSPFDILPHDKVIYIVRHPMDVAISGANYNAIPLETMVEAMLLPGFYSNLPIGTYEVTGSWGEHVTHWRRETRCPVLVVTYRDLVGRTPEALSRMVEFIWGEADPARIAHAVEHSEFERQKAAESETGFKGAPPSFQGQFFREGRPGQWREAMPSALAERIEAAFGELMDEYGFERMGAQTPAASPARSSRA